MDDAKQADDVLGFYDDDYVFVATQSIARERTENELAFICEALKPKADHRLLDLGCGYGRIANGLAQRGVSVTGVEAKAALLNEARSSALKRGLTVEYLLADIRAPLTGGPYDSALLWFFTFGYHSDDDNLSILRHVAAALKSGGKLLLDQYNTAALARTADQHTVLDFGDSLIIQKPIWDLAAGRWGAERVAVRDGQIRRARFLCRCYTVPELRNMLGTAGYRDIQFFGDGFEPITPSSTRIIALATKA